MSLWDVAADGWLSVVKELSLKGNREVNTGNQEAMLG